MEPIVIGRGVEIPESELEMTFSRSGGPGGQHVNKTETRVTLRFDVANSPSLPEHIREKLLARLASRLGGALDADAIASMDPEAFAEVARTKPALHRFPASQIGGLITIARSGHKKCDRFVTGRS